MQILEQNLYEQASLIKVQNIEERLTEDPEPTVFLEICPDLVTFKIVFVQDPLTLSTFS